jgi:hypothetical protein
MKGRKDETFLHCVGREIGREAKRQIRGSREELLRHVSHGWGQEFAHQIFGIPRHRRRSSR